MPRKTKKQLRGQKAAEARWSVQPVDLEARRLAFSVLVEGCRPEQTLHLLRWLDMGRIRTFPNPARKHHIVRWVMGPQAARFSLPFHGDLSADRENN